MADRVRIDGLADFNRNLRKLDTNAPKALRLALNDATDIVIDYARPRVAMLTGRARKSIKASSTRTLARVKAGGKRAPYYPWLDFGGRTGIRRSVHRKFIKEGRYLYKGLAVKRDEFTESLNTNLRRVAITSGLDVD